MHRMKDEHRRADRNRDGIITRDEMTAALAAYARNRSRDSRSGSDGEGGFSVADRWADRNSYRFLSPLERLPEGLPEWFLSKDTDADGQIAMAEYATDWSTPRAAEANVTGFRRFDLNGDGIITPKECIAAEEAAELADAATETSAGGTTTPSRTHDPRQPARSEPAKVWSGW